MKLHKSTLLLLTPSWVSNLIGAFVGLGVVIATLVFSSYQGSQLQQEIFEVHTSAAAHPANTSSYQTVTTNLANNHVLGVAPLFILWAFVGLVVYFFAVSIVSALGNAVALRQQMGYMNTSRSSLLKHALVQFGVRLLAVVAWFAFIKLSLSVVLPYALAAANASAANLASPSNIGAAVLAAAVLFTDIYIHAIFFRLVLLKPRVLSGSLLR